MFSTASKILRENCEKLVYNHFSNTKTTPDGIIRVISFYKI